MPVEVIAFGATAFIVIASALMVIVSRQPVYSALYLVLTFLGLAGFYLQLNASFIAAVQVLVYAGAIVVLFLFVIMLLGEDKPLPGEDGFGMPKWLGVVFSLALVGQLGFMLTRLPVDEALAEPSPVRIVASAGEVGETVPYGSVKAMGNTLFTEYLFAFEATSVVLLIAMIGVVVLAKRRL